MSILLIITIVTFYISIIGFAYSYSFSIVLSIIPGVNIYYYFKYLNIHWILLLLITISIILPISRVFTLTALYVYLPFLTCYAKGKSFIYGIITLIIPFVMYPLLAFVISDGEVEK